MATVALTKDNFKETIDSNEIVLVDFWAPWCGPCKSFGPIYEEVSERHPDVVFAKVNTEEEQELAAAFQIRSIPTVMAFRDQIIVFAQPGLLPGPALDELIRRVRELDMDAVRREIEQQQGAQPAP